MQRLYDPGQTGLEYKVECRSPEPIHYLDMHVVQDASGLSTDLFDKRVAMAGEGKMGEVRRFPHVESTLSPECLYNAYKGFLARVYRCTMRRAYFVRAAAEHLLDMRRHGYGLKRLVQTLSTFMRHKYIPRPSSASVEMRVCALVAKGVCQAEAVARARAESESCVSRRGEDQSWVRSVRSRSRVTEDVSEARRRMVNFNLNARRPAAQTSAERAQQLLGPRPSLLPLSEAWVSERTGPNE